MKQLVWILIFVGAVALLHVATDGRERARPEAPRPAPPGARPTGSPADAEADGGLELRSTIELPVPRAPISPAPELRLEHRAIGSLLGPGPAARVTADDGTSNELTLGHPVSLRGPVQLHPVGRGWLLDRAVATPEDGPIVTVTATSRHLLELSVVETGGGRPLEELACRVETRWIEGCCPTGVESEPQRLWAPGGLALIEGLELGAGEVRVTAWTDSHRPARTEWLEAPGGPIVARLELRPSARSTGWLEVLAVDADGRPLEGVRLAAIEDDLEAPVVDAWRVGGALQVARAGPGDPPSVPSTASTGPAGRARLEVRAPGRYRVHADLVSSSRAASALGAVLEVGVGDELDLRLELVGSGALHGIVPGFELDGCARTAEAVVLELAGRRAVAALGSGGAFQFTGLFPGTYRAELRGRAEDPRRSGATLPSVLATRAVTVEPGTSTVLHFGIGPDAPGRSVQVRMPNLEPGEPWRWILLAVTGPETPGADPWVHVRTTVGNGATTVLCGLPDGELTVAGLGFRAGSADLALARARVARGATAVALGLPTGPIELRTTGAEDLTARLRSRADDAVERWLIDQLPAVEVPADGTTRLFPPGGRSLELLVEGEVFEVGRDGALWLPARATR